MNDIEKTALADDVAIFFCTSVLSARHTDDLNGFSSKVPRQIMPISSLREYYRGDSTGPVARLIHWIQHVESIRCSLENFDVEDTFGDWFEDLIDRIESGILESATVGHFVDEVAAIAGIPQEEAFQFVSGGLLSCAQAIITGRLVFAGKRYGLTESIFEACQEGLFVFGFQEIENQLLCVGPGQD